MMQNADLIRMIELKYCALSPVLDERQRRQWAAAEALAYGWGGVTAVCEATGMSQDTVRKGITELAARVKLLLPGAFADQPLYQRHQVCDQQQQLELEFTPTRRKSRHEISVLSLGRRILDVAPYYLRQLVPWRSISAMAEQARKACPDIF